MPQKRDLPTGTVAFFFSDVQDSTGLLQRLGERYKDVLERHAAIVRGCLGAHNGIEVSTEGDSFFAVFPNADDSVVAAGDIQQRLAAEPWPTGGTVAVRIGLHVGTAELGLDNYIGIDVTRAARIGAAGHGGQVVVSESVKALVTGADYSDLGEHSLKGLERPERLYQFDVPGLPQTFPPLRTSSVRANNLPALASRIVGRSNEEAQLLELLSTNRLVTVTGPGGIGKTRLALEVANRALGRFEEGAFFVDLTAVNDPELVYSAIGAEVGVQMSGNGDLAAALAKGDRLLVLDNLEQLVAAAPRLADLMAAAHPLKILATSQVPLRIGGEVVMRLERLPGGEASPAAELFAARATQADPAFDIDTHREDVGRLVDTLDGVPLAIELAAARVNVLTPAQILDRIGSGILKSARADTPARHRSISAAVEWSYGLLSADQQQLLQGMSVFRGGATMDAIEAVATQDPLDDLAELVDRSLVITEAATVGKRFDMLSSVAQFAAGQVTERDELVARHADWYCRLAHRAHEPLDGDTRARWIAVLGDDLENLRATMDHLLATGDVERGFDLLGSIWRFFQSSGRLDELDLWLGRFFAADTTDAPTRPRARALIARAARHYWQADYYTTAADYEEAIAIAEAIDDKRLQAEAWAGLTSTRGGAVAVDQYVGDPIEAIDRAGQLAVELEDPGLMATVEFGRIAMNTVLADAQTLPAMNDLEQLLRLYEQDGELMNIAHTQLMLSELYIAHGDCDGARSWVLKGIETAEKAGDTFTMTWALHRYAIAAIELGDVIPGARIAAASSEGRARAGGTFPPPFFPIGEPEERAIAALGEAGADDAFAEGRDLSLFEAVALAREIAATP